MFDLNPLPIIIALGFLAHLVGLVYFQRKAGIPQSAQSTIDILKEQIDAQQTKLKGYNDTIIEMTKEAAQLKEQAIAKDVEAKRIADLLLQRDPQSAQFTTMAVAAMKQVNEIAAIVKETHTTVLTTNKNIEKLYTSIEKHLRVMEKK